MVFRQKVFSWRRRAINPPLLLCCHSAISETFHVSKNLNENCCSARRSNEATLLHDSVRRTPCPRRGSAHASSAMAKLDMTAQILTVSHRRARDREFMSVSADTITQGSAQSIVKERRHLRLALAQLLSKNHFSQLLGPIGRTSVEILAQYIAEALRSQTLCTSPL